MRFYHSLNFKLFVTSLLLTGGVLVSLYYLFYQRSLNTLERDITHELEGVAFNISERFANQVERRLVSDARFLLSAPSLERYFHATGEAERDAHREELSLLFERTLSFHSQQVYGIYLFDAHGQIKVQAQAQTPAQAKPEQAVDLTVVASAMLRQLLQQPQRHSHTLVWRYPVPAYYTRNLLALPVEDLHADGQQHGVLLVDFDVQGFLDSLRQKITYFFYLDFFLLDAQGKPLRSPLQDELTFSPIPYLQRVGESSVTAFDKGYVLRIPLNFSDSADAGYLLASGVSRDIFVTETDKLLYALGGAAALAIVLVSLLTWYLSRLFLQPVLLLSEQARQMAVGKLNQVQPLGGERARTRSGKCRPRLKSCTPTSSGISLAWWRRRNRLSTRPRKPVRPSTSWPCSTNPWSSGCRSALPSWKKPSRKRNTRPR